MTIKNKHFLKMERRSQMRKINAARPIPSTKKFDGITYHLIRTGLYKSQLDHEAKYVREHGGLARVVAGSVKVGMTKTHGWRLYTKE